MTLAKIKQELRSHPPDSSSPLYASVRWVSLANPGLNSGRVLRVRGDVVVIMSGSGRKWLVPVRDIKNVWS